MVPLRRCISISGIHEPREHDGDGNIPVVIPIVMCERPNAAAVTAAIANKSNSSSSLFCYPPFARAKGEVFVLLYVCLFVRSTISQQPAADSRHILHAGVAWVGTCLLPFWGSATPVGGKKRENDVGVVSFVHRTATIYISLSDAKCSPICRAQTCAHSGVEPSRSSKAFLQGGPKSSKKISNFSPIRDFTSICLRNY